MRKIAFLGFCERSAHVRDQNSDFFKWNILGLKNIIWSNIYPLVLGNLDIGLAFNMTENYSNINFKIEDEDEKEVGYFQLKFDLLSSNNALEFSEKQSGSFKTPIPKYGWLTAFIPMKDTDIVILKPGSYRLVHEDDNERDIIGIVYFGVSDPEPLSEARINAIKSDPLAAKAATMEIGCKNCPSKLKIYSAIEQNSDLEVQGYVNNRKISDEFICSCGSTTVDLRIIKKNFHGALGKRFSENKKLNFIPFYEKSNLETIRLNFIQLLNNNPKEELIQKFIQDNPILLHQFLADKIYFKPPILTSFKADFGIITAQKEFILIEIEKAETRLLNKNGTVASELSHAIDQVLNWFQLIEDHKIAVLEEIGIKRENINKIRGIVIAGREKNYNSTHLKKLKSQTWSNITFYTYDDLISAIGALINNLDE